MIDTNHDSLSIRRQSVILGVSRSNLYYHPVPQFDESILANEIHELWLSKAYYGYRRITAELKRQGHEVNHKRILRMMRDMRIQALYPHHKTTSYNPEHKKYPYLLQGLKIEGPNHVWQTDITYIKMLSGFMYLVGVIDVYSRFLVAWSFSNTMETGLCQDMLEQALQHGKKPVILNTDQGCQFTSNTWIEQVEGNGIQVSMDGKGRWADNIIIERFWRTLKHEHVLLHSFESAKAARSSIGEFINTYNHERLHQSLGYQTPAEVYFMK